MLTVLVDYDSGNLHSAEKAFQRMAQETDAGQVIVSSRPEDVARADRIVLPGDGAFPACRAALDRVTGMGEAIAEAVTGRGVPFLGICIGMQMLATRGLEHRETILPPDLFEQYSMLSFWQDQSNSRASVVTAKPPALHTNAQRITTK